MRLEFDPQEEKKDEQMGKSTDVNRASSGKTNGD